MTIAAPPYTYDDPRLLYDEICFFYDGGYDSVCLGGSIVVGRATTNAEHAKRKKEKTDKPFINIFIESKLLEVNDIEIEPDKESSWYRFAGESDIIEIYINDIKIDITKPIVEGKFVEIIKSIVSYSGSLESNTALAEHFMASSSFYITTKVNTSPVVVDKILEPNNDFYIDMQRIVDDKDKLT